MATLADVLAESGLADDQAAGIAVAWPEHGALAPEPDFLAAEAVSAQARRLGMPDGHIAALVDGLELFRARPGLRRLAGHMASVLRSPLPQAGRLQWPQLPADLHPAAALFYAWPLLACLDTAVAMAGDRGIPPSTALAAFRDLERWMDFHRQATGTWGFAQIGWLHRHVQGRIYELGRLQFAPSAWDSCVHAFRRHADGSVALLMAGGIAVRDDGRLQGTARRPHDAGGFETALDEDAAAWTGNPVSPEGAALRQVIRLDKERWSRIASPQDPVLAIHIPAGGGLDPAACDAACHAALIFFARHFPEHPFTALVSDSWLFDPHLAAHLPAASNIIRFQRGFLLHPCADAHGTQIIERVFGDPAIDPLHAECRTTLQKAVAAHVRSGGYWSSGGAFLPLDRAGKAFS